VALALLNKTDPEKELRRMRNVLRGERDTRWGRSRKEAVLLMGHETFDHLLYTSLIINYMKWGGD